ncbi:MAG: class I SAM-dependent methyltransferase [Actinomycetota bacterium]|nr:class I SAM-dependent methyltransferase [Actinomycetota bacterium]
MRLKVPSPVRWPPSSPRSNLSGLRSPDYPHLVRRTVGYRLPLRSLVVDVDWRPGSPLGHFADDYPTVAVGADPPPSALNPSLRAAVRRLPLADASVDCALLVDPEGGVVGEPGTLAEVARILRPGGLVVVSATETSSRHRSFLSRPVAIAGIVVALTDLGLAPEQVTHLEPVLNPRSLVSRIQVRARSGRPADAANKGLPLACRLVAAVNHLDRARTGQRGRVRASSVLVFARKP